MVFNKPYLPSIKSLLRNYAGWVASILFLILSGSSLCIEAGPAASEKGIIPPIVITKEQNGSRIKTAPGSIIEIRLPFLGSAGYGWYLEDLDKTRLELVRETTQPMDGAGRIGGPVLGIWDIRTLKSGPAIIKMHYYRLWEGADTAKEHFTIEVEVE
jgi:predicted secreted protein